jgi:hypothetical protein
MTHDRDGWGAQLLPSLLVLVIPALAAYLHEARPDSYRWIIQEDEALEWASFWSFSLAAAAYARAGWHQRGARPPPIFLLGVALFCGFVAMEEISWGQRLLGVRPPAYFLEQNFQQELNLHNVVADPLRQAAFLGVVYGFGVVLPLLALWPRARALFDAVGIAAPSPILIPGFVATGLLYDAYPWTHTGEWAELMLGVGMLFAALLRPYIGPTTTTEGRFARADARIAAAFVITWTLGAATAAAWSLVSAGREEHLQAARIELDALKRDIKDPRSRTRCGVHKRVYSYVERYGHDHLFSGNFAQLSLGGLEEERALYFLDPWNSPYWYVHECSDDLRRRAIFVYSFGPNRRRDSTDWEIRGDDLGAFAIRPEPLDE